MNLVACPIALHPDGSPRRIPAFTHPTQGLELVSGPIATGENPEAAAARKLYQMSGLETRATIYVGQSDAIRAGEIWHFSLCRVVPPVRAAWAHLDPTQNGPLLRYDWLKLDAATPHPLDQTYRTALAWIKAQI